MKSIKKLYGLLLGTLMLSTGFFGCNPQPEKVVKEDLSKPIELKQTTLSFYFVGTPKTDARKVLDKIEERTQKNLNVKLDFKWVSANEFAKKISTIEASDEIFDAFQCTSNVVSTSPVVNFSSMAHKGQLKDITQLLPRYAPGIYKACANELPSATVNGKIVAVPSRYPIAYNSYAIVREDLVKKYNIPPIKTLNDYETYLKTIKDNEKNLVPGRISMSSLLSLNGAYGYVIADLNNVLLYSWKDPQMKLIPWEQTPEFNEVVKYITAWKAKDYLIRTAGKDTVDYLTSQKISSYLFAAQDLTPSGTLDSSINELNGIIKRANPNAELRAYGLYPEVVRQRLSPLGDYFLPGSIAFNARSSNTERALMFLNWIQQSQENYDLFMYGVKDEHYTLKGEQYSPPEGVTMVRSPYLNWQGRVAFKNIEYERMPSNAASGEKERYAELMNKSTRYAPHEGFYPDFAPVEKECTNRVNYIIDKIITPLLYGQYEPDDTGTKIRELKNLGTEQIVTEVQKQLDQWRQQNKK